jgi:hypothetical protein
MTRSTEIFGGKECKECVICVDLNILFKSCSCFNFHKTIFNFGCTGALFRVQTLQTPNNWLPFGVPAAQRGRVNMRKKYQTNYFDLTSSHGYSRFNHYCFQSKKWCVGWCCSSDKMLFSCLGVREREMLSLSFYILCSLRRNLQFLVKSLTAQRKSLWWQLKPLRHWGWTHPTKF